MMCSVDFETLYVTLVQEKKKSGPSKILRRSTGACGRFRGVTQHCRTRKWEAHIWKGGKSVYLGSFNDSWQAAFAHDLAAIGAKGATAVTNFNVSIYQDQLETLVKLGLDDLVEILRKQRRGKNKNSSRFRGVTRHQKGKWEARIGAMDKRKYRYLGLFVTEEAAARAYDREAVRGRGQLARTNFPISDYQRELDEFDQQQQGQMGEAGGEQQEIQKCPTAANASAQEEMSGKEQVATRSSDLHPSCCPQDRGTDHHLVSQYGLEHSNIVLQSSQSEPLQPSWLLSESGSTGGSTGGSSCLMPLGRMPLESPDHRPQRDTGQQTWPDIPVHFMAGEQKDVWSGHPQQTEGHPQQTECDVNSCSNINAMSWARQQSPKGTWMVEDRWEALVGSTAPRFPVHHETKVRPMREGVVAHGSGEVTWGQEDFCLPRPAVRADMASPTQCTLGEDQSSPVSGALVSRQLSNREPAPAPGSNWSLWETFSGDTGGPSPQSTPHQASGKHHQVFYSPRVSLLGRMRPGEGISPGGHAWSPAIDNSQSHETHFSQTRRANSSSCLHVQEALTCEALWTSDEQSRLPYAAPQLLRYSEGPRVEATSSRMQDCLYYSVPGNEDRVTYGGDTNPHGHRRPPVVCSTYLVNGHVQSLAHFQVASSQSQPLQPEVSAAHTSVRAAPHLGTLGLQTARMESSRTWADWQGTTSCRMEYSPTRCISLLQSPLVNDPRGPAPENVSCTLLYTERRAPLTAGGGQVHHPLLWRSRTWNGTTS